MLMKKPGFPILERYKSTLKDTENMVKKMKSGKISILIEFWEFLRVRKKWWLGPIVLFLLLLGLLIVITEGSALAPFIYTLF